VEPRHWDTSGHASDDWAVLWRRLSDLSKHCLGPRRTYDEIHAASERYLSAAFGGVEKRNRKAVVIDLVEPDPVFLVKALNTDFITQTTTPARRRYAGRGRRQRSSSSSSDESRSGSDSDSRSRSGSSNESDGDGGGGGGSRSGSGNESGGGGGGSRSGSGDESGGDGGGGGGDGDGPSGNS
jgi:hypothetical protein